MLLKQSWKVERKLKLIRSRAGVSNISFNRRTARATKRLANNSDLTENAQVIAILESLLEKAKAGDVSGMMYVVNHKGENHGVGVAGDYLSDLQSGIAAFCLVYGLLGDNLRRHSQQAPSIFAYRLLSDYCN